MIVTANFSNDTTKDVTSDMILSGFDSTFEGDVTVTVSHTEKDITLLELNTNRKLSEMLCKRF